MRALLTLAVILSSVSHLLAQDNPRPNGNRLAYLDELSLYHPNKDFPKLTTPQWVGEDGVEVHVNSQCYHLVGKRWKFDSQDTKSLDAVSNPNTLREGSFAVRDLSGNGTSQIIFRGEDGNMILGWEKERRWQKLPFQLPAEAELVSVMGGDAGLRFVDLDGDGTLDLLISNENCVALFLFEGLHKGWRKVFLQRLQQAPIVKGRDWMFKSRDPEAEVRSLPLISRFGADNGFFIHSRHLWWANEDTVILKNHVDKRSFAEILKGK